MSAGFGTGIDGQFGIAEESAYGTYVAPTRFYEFNTASIVPAVQKLYSMPIGAGRTQQTSRRRTFITGGSGTVEIDAVNRGLGLLLKHMFGDVVSAQVAATAEWTHTFTKSADGKRGMSLTVQEGIPPTDIAVQPFSFVGGKITAWTMAAALDDILKITPTFDFMNLTTAENLEAPSYAADPEPFTFLDGTLTIDGSGIGTIRGVTINWAEAFNVDRRSFGNTKREPLANGELAITGSFESEFTDMNAYEAWVNGDEIVDLLVTFTGSTIPGEANPYKLVITVPSLEYTGDAPQISGPDVVPQTINWKALDNGTDEIITAVYHTDDTAP